MLPWCASGHLWGETKRAELLSSLARPRETLYEEVKPPLALGLPFMPGQMQTDYLSWPLLPDLMPQSFPGVKTSRDDFVVDIDRQQLERRIRQYFDPSVSHEAIRQLMPSAMSISAKGQAEMARDF